jgi:hypothetical protein
MVVVGTGAAHGTAAAAASAAAMAAAAAVQQQVGTGTGQAAAIQAALQQQVLALQVQMAQLNVEHEQDVPGAWPADGRAGLWQLFPSGVLLGGQYRAFRTPHGFLEKCCQNMTLGHAEGSPQAEAAAGASPTAAAGAGDHPAEGSEVADA